MTGLAEETDLLDGSFRQGLGHDEQAIIGMNQFSSQGIGGMGKHVDVLQARIGKSPIEVETHMLDVVGFLLADVVNADGLRRFRYDKKLVIEGLAVSKQGETPVLA